VFQAGHSIRLEVSSSCFPVYDPNPNAGKGYFNASTGKQVVAQQHVFHDRDRPSHLTLPVIPRP
jgi:predicted acyl esterase